MPVKLSILLVDDEKVSAEGLKALLDGLGHEAEWAENGEEALETLKSKKFDILITDLMMPGMDGFALVQRVKKLYPQMIIFIFTGYDSFKLARKAQSLGADDFLLKPVDMDQLTIVLSQAKEKIQLKENLIHLGQFIENKYAQKNIIGQSKPMQDVFRLIEKASVSKGNVLIRGESGTGKELVARAIYGPQASSNPKFVSVNCCAISENLIESELFGHVRGSFSGAYTDRQGLFEIADGGTIFLDEIGEIPPSLQMKLLRVLQEKEVRRVGDNKTRFVNVRIIAATNTNLEKGIENGSFREDLYYRLNVIPINLPTLRERLEDVPILVNHFIQKYSDNPESVNISSDGIQALMEYNYPGNIRELENIIQRIISFANQDPIEMKDILPHLGTHQEPLPTIENEIDLDLNYDSFKTHQEEAEKKFLIHHLKTTKFNVAKTADLLKISRTSCHNRITRLNIDLESLRDDN